MPNVIDMHVDGNQSLGPREGEIDIEAIGHRLPFRRSLCPLERSAVDKKHMMDVYLQLMAEASHADKSAMMENEGVPHELIP